MSELYPKLIETLSDEELIREHTYRWQAWMKRRRDFGEMGAVGDPRLVELELEARRRGISDAKLLEPVESHQDPEEPNDT